MGWDNREERLQNLSLKQRSKGKTEPYEVAWWFNLDYGGDQQFFRQRIWTCLLVVHETNDVRYKTLSVANMQL